MATHPDNTEDTAYAAFALVGALIDVLMEKGLLVDDDLSAIRDAAYASVQKVNNNARDRVAKFILSWMPRKKGK